MRIKWLMMTVILGIILLGMLLGVSVMSDVEKPKYKVVKSGGTVEIRQYEPMIIAKVEIIGQREEAIRLGFQLLADYIFGNNTLKQAIAMTAPVEQQQGAGYLWQVSFVMPSEYTIERLPKPIDKRVTLKEVPSKQFVVIQFSGTNSDENLNKHEDKLIGYAKANDIRVVGTPKYAFYNPPWTLPLLRRNEVMMEIKL